MASKLKLMNENGKVLSIESGSIESDKLLDPRDFKYIRDTISSLGSISNPLDGDVCFVKGYHTNDDNAGGTFIYRANKAKSEHNGGTIIDPSKEFPTNWNDATQVTDWFTADSTDNGIWERVYTGSIDVKWFGAKGDYMLPNGIVNNSPTDDTLAIQSALNTKEKVEFTLAWYKTTSLLTAYNYVNGNSAIINCFGDGIKMEKINNITIQDSIRLENISLQGNKTGTGLQFGDNYLSRTKYANVRISNFEVGLDLTADNLYLLSFVGCLFDGIRNNNALPTGTCVKIDASLTTNSGENISFINCSFADSNVCIDNNGYELFFNGCSFDYSNTFIKSTGYYAHNSIINSHFETKWNDATYGSIYYGNASVLVIKNSNIFINNSNTITNGGNWDNYFFVNADSATLIFTDNSIGIDPSYPYHYLINKNNSNMFHPMIMKNNVLGKNYTFSNSYIDTFLTQDVILGYFNVDNTVDADTTIAFDATDIPNYALPNARSVIFNNTTDNDYYVTLTSMYECAPGNSLSLGGFFRVGDYTTTPSTSITVWFLAADQSTVLGTESIPFVGNPNEWVWKNIHINYAPAGTAYVKFRIAGHFAQSCTFSMNSISIGKND